MATPAKFLSLSNEWYTPKEVVNSARYVMGSIDLDPATCEYAQQEVKAYKYFTITDNGLEQEWKADRVFLNPPGGRINNRSSACMWFNKLMDEYDAGNVKEAVFVGFNLEQMTKDVRFFDFPMCMSSYIATSPVVTKSGRLRFVKGDTGELGKAPTYPTFISYLPPCNVSEEDRFAKETAFMKEFSQYGLVGRFNRYGPTVS